MAENRLEGKTLNTRKEGSTELPDPKETVLNIFWERCRQNPYRVAVLQKQKGQFQPVTWHQCGEIVSEIAAGLLSLGLKAEDKAAIVSYTRAEWTWSDLAILSIRAISVPVYPTLKPNEMRFLLEHSDSKFIFLENRHQLHKLLEQEEISEALEYAILMEGEAPATEGKIHVLSWTQLRQLGAAYLQKYPHSVEEATAQLLPEQIATIVYTSGTTGVPKGAIITHGNIYFICRTLSVSVAFHPDDVALSFLPLSHIFERVSGQFLAIYDGFVLAYAESMDTVSVDMLAVRPTIMNAVPRFYEKVYSRVMAQIRSLARPQQILAKWAMSIGKRAAQARAEGLEPAQALSGMFRAELKLADRLVFSKVRQRLGGRLRFMSSGAAPLSVEIHNFFGAIGIPILEGYGLTETTAPVSCNRLGDIKIGSVGKPLNGVQVAIAEDGEIMVKGPNVFAGYYKNPEATAEAFRDGWFLTGDIGELDKDGFLSIKDRKKDIIITAGGKHIAPQYIENRLAGKGIISRLLVYGDRRKYITALVTLNHDALRAFARVHGQSHIEVEKFQLHPSVYNEVDRLIQEVNRELASFEQIKRFLILEEDFTVEADELTPTLKLKRKFVIEKYRKLLDSMYDAEEVSIETG